VPVVLMVLIGVLAVSVGMAAYAAFAERERRGVIGRAFPDPAANVVAIKSPAGGARGWLTRWLLEQTPTSWAKAPEGGMLVHAGFDGVEAPAIYGAIRIGTVVAGAILAVAVAPRHNTALFLATVGLGLAIGLSAPPAILARLARRRQDAFRRAIPDALDLLVVCVEAGISLDAAILRVAKEMATLHPDLAAEFLLVNRKVNAGITREAALHGLWERTGLEELRGLASNMIQSERWGTSIATVLRVYAETLRRRRKQTAERKAATAPLKMLFPLGLFIFPSIFVVIIGPAFIKIYEMLHK
jgi:tight adherence protein C